MAISDVLEYIGDDLKKVSAVMESTLQSDIELLNKANDSILSNNGKMLRPMITILSALSCSGTKNEDTISYAAATELLHNATLLHDDVVDDSCLRRGKPTIVSLMGAGPSVLLGDYWLVKAVDLVLGRNHAMEVTKIFSKTLSDLASGEMLQMQCSTECNTTEEDYYRIIYSKTASLFETAGTVGAISVNASPEQKETIRGFSYNLGMAFQIKDDILDYEGSETLGKPAGQDLKEQKVTLPLFGAFASVDKKEEALIRKKLSGVTENPSAVDEILSFVKDNKGIKWAENRLTEWVDKAVSTLRKLPASHPRDILEELTYFVSERRH